MNDEKEYNLTPEDQIPGLVHPSPGEQLPPEEGAAPGGQSTETVEVGSKLKITRHFAVGFLGWFVVNGLVWLGLLLFIISANGVEKGLELFRSPDQYMVAASAACYLPLNLLTLLVIFKKFQQIAFGFLAAIGLNFFISLLLGVVSNALCFIPFFYQ